MYPGIVLVDKQNPDAIKSKSEALKPVINFEFLFTHGSCHEMYFVLLLCLPEFSPSPCVIRSKTPPHKATLFSLLNTDQKQKRDKIKRDTNRHPDKYLSYLAREPVLLLLLNDHHPMAHK